MSENFEVTKTAAARKPRPRRRRPAEPVTYAKVNDDALAYAHQLAEDHGYHVRIQDGYTILLTNR